MNRKVMLAFAIATAGCVGVIGGGDEERAPDPAPNETPSQTSPLSLPLRPLTPYELSRTLEDVLGDRAPEIAALQPSALKAPTEVLVGPETIWSGARADLLEDALYAVAARIAKSCTDEACVASFFARELPHLWRRDPTTDETAKLVSLAHDLSPKVGFADAFARAIEAALLAPDFLYLTSFGDDARPVAGGIELAPFELASRLSYLLWSSAPDDALLDAARRDDLRTDAALERETRRMLADPRAARGIARFVHNWTGEINLASKPHGDPAWSADLARSALVETEQFVGAWFRSEKRDFASLLVSDTTYVTPSLAAFYGVSTSGADIERIAMPSGRVGLFTQASFLATHATESASSPTLRGKWFMERALCHAMGSPPVNAAAMAPPFESWMQTRDWHEKLQGTKGCNACHGLMEPAGYVYEGFDAIGRARTTEREKPVRTNATLTTDTDMDGSYAGPLDFSAAAAKSAVVRRCFASNWVSHALGRGLNDAESTLLASVANALESDAQEALVRITTSAAFRRAQAK